MFWNLCLVERDVSDGECAQCAAIVKLPHTQSTSSKAIYVSFQTLTEPSEHTAKFVVTYSKHSNSYSCG